MSLSEIKEQILNCRDCQGKFGFEPSPVFFGTKKSRIMQISQAPSLLVHQTGRPFNDLSGKRLRGEWYQIKDADFYNPFNFYITSIAHCYPGKNKGTGDRLPPKSCAKKWLKLEMDEVQNQIYIIIGKQAADYFFPKSDFTSLIFKNHFLNEKPAYVLPHPSPLNVKWFKDNPKFEKERIKEVREAVHKTLGF